MRTLMNHLLARFFVAALALSFGPTVTYIFAQDQPHALHMSTDRVSLAQVVALDECDPTTFKRKTRPQWDFEPDTIHIHEGTSDANHGFAFRKPRS